MDIPDVQEGTGEAAVADLTTLVNEEDRLSQETGALQRRLGKLDQLSSSISEYGVTLTSQEDRMQGVGWFQQKLKDSHTCPLCSAIHTNGNPHLADLVGLADELRSLTASVSQAPAKLDQELADLKQELRGRESALSKARQKRKFLENRSAEMASHRQRVRQIYLFVGRVEQALENVTASRNVDDLSSKVRDLATRIANLKRDLDPRASRERLNAAVDSVSGNIASYARLLKLEHSNENVRVNISELTLQFSPLSGRTDFLWEVGSGQNWVGYHIAGLLGLHEHFENVVSNPVPKFLIVDQPSQVYFPEAWPSMEERELGQSSDIAGVRRIFEALAGFLDKIKGGFQIIVTEHAGAITWEGIPHIHLVANWRQGHDDFLIPKEWIGPGK